jgi:hypothetical protein
VFDITEHEEVGWCEIMGVGLVGEDAQAIFATQRLTFRNGVDGHLVGIKTESSLLPYRAQLKENCMNIVTVHPLVGLLPFRSASSKGNVAGFHAIVTIVLLVLNRMPWSFMEVEHPIDGYNELPDLLFDGPEITEQLICQSDIAVFLGACEGVRKVTNRVWTFQTDAAFVLSVSRFICITWRFVNRPRIGRSMLELKAQFEMPAFMRHRQFAISCMTVRYSGLRSGFFPLVSPVHAAFAHYYIPFARRWTLQL